MKLWRSSYFNPAIHVFVWLLLLSIPALLLRNSEDTVFNLPPHFFILTSLYHIGIFYLNAYILYPRLLTRKRWWLYLLSLLILIRISYPLKLFFLKLDADFRLTPENGRIIFFGLFPFLIASIIFRLVVNRIRAERREKEAKAERLTSELKFLRSQVSPHFLFNTMSNLVSLARQQSSLLEPSLIKLSELLRYMLYESNEEEISIAREIEHLQNYIELQQLRFGDDVAVTLRLTNNCPDCLVEPMLLIPFIENAFKHGVALVHKPYIDIVLTVDNKTLDFQVRNNYSDANLSKDKNSGIGLVNLKNRLSLLYPGKHKLTICDEDGVYSVHLNINLS